MKGSAEKNGTFLGMKKQHDCGWYGRGHAVVSPRSANRMC